ncbi:unnamed protein product [Arabidopsis thaliana]|uniref:Peptidase C19 ubiquitin carboxyl-terminal hydrolase domain-containing protein n=1 Tax=Arabidopsis thaliana TaxID=3702 RepID=A0A5S9WS45_ARATH|nr:unnamed protein product [Arabidopsis thaliana]
MEKDEDIDKKLDIGYDAEESSLNMILKSLWQISVFARQNIVRQSFTGSFLKEAYFVFPLSTISVSANLRKQITSLTCLYTSWRIYLREIHTLKCTNWRTRFAIDARWIWSIQLNVLMGLFENLTFEKIVQIIRIGLKMPCDKEGCGKRNYVQRMINKLPTVFTIALEWEHNETEGEIFDTTSVLATEIDVSVIYQYEGDSAFTKYHLVSMVCSDGDRYNCVAYEDNRWVRHVGSQKKVIGDWDGVLSIFRELHIRPEILFFENREQMFSAQGSQASCVIS